jgi:hypothetical protein
MKHSIKRSALLVAASSLLAAYSASAANTYYAPGDLVLYFQQEGGTNTVYANLGNAATLYRGSAAGTAGDNALTKGNILNLNTTLTSAFGAGWASDTSVYAGLAGVWGTSQTITTLQDGDPHRTLYVSASRNGVGTVGTPDSTAWDLTLAGNTTMTAGATGIQTQNNAFENNYDVQATVSLAAVSLIDEQNPFLAAGVQGNAFGAFAGGVQQRGTAGTIGTFDGVGSVEYALDLYRILGRNNVSGQVGGDLRVGSFEGTVVVGSNGQVSFLVPEPSTIALSGLAAAALMLRRRRSA